MPKVNIVKAASLSGHAGSIYILLSDPQAPNIFYSGSGDGKVIRWDLSDFSKGVVLAQVPSNIFSLLMIPQLDKMLVGQLQGGIHVLDLKEKKEVRHLAYHTQGVFDLQYDAAQNLVLAAGG
ncbi:MAG TPA: hypothetical protein VNJ07_10950, partial [Chitinophagales bacterium]|nr:hypothetical protein [Chitinophagales bacterium]